MTGGNLRLGVVGAGGRGGAFLGAINDHDAAEIHAVCDVDLYDTGALETAAEDLDASEAYHDYNAMLVESDLDAVVIGTPIQHHATQSIAALERDIHVLCEVPAGVWMGECRDLVQACDRSAGQYTLAENYIYRRSNRHVEALVEAGLFGDVYYAEGEYLHELKELQERTSWRRIWGSGRNGITYPTHSLGPILRWFNGDRVDRVTCAGSGHHYADSHGKPYAQEDTNVMLVETERDRLIKLRFDTLSERPHAMTNYQLQGTEGCYEAARAPDETNRIWLDEFEEAANSGEYRWRELEAVEDHLPEEWIDPPDVVKQAGHGGGDYFVMKRFLDSLSEGSAPPIGIHEAMDMILPGLVSVRSIQRNGEWIDVPDSRDW